MKIPYLEECYEEWKNKELFHHYFIRRIECPHGYVNTKYWSVISAAMELMDTTPNEEKAVARSIANAGMPTDFLAPEFMESVLATTPPEEFAIDEIKLPLESMLVVLPAAQSIAYFGFLMPFIGYTICNALDTQTKRETGKHVLVFHGILLPDDGKPIGYYGRVPTHDKISDLSKYDFVDHTGTNNDEVMKRWEVRGLKNLDIHDPGTRLPDVRHDRIIPDKAFTLLSKMFLILNTRPNFIDVTLDMPKTAQSSKLIAEKNHYVNKKGLWKANFIGLGYRAERHETPIGTHASPRMHWRRGHLRRQRFGKGRTEVKTVWIEPVLVNAI